MKAAPRSGFLAPFLVLSLSLLLMGITNRGTWTPDEPRVAAICREMSIGGDFVVPHLGGQPFVEKPPLYFAVGALFFRWLAPFVGDVGAVRMASVLFGLGTAGAAFLLARRLLGPDRAPLALLFLATTYGFVEQSHEIRVDMALLFAVTAAAFCLGEAYLGGRSWFLLATGGPAGLAFLAKGIIGPALIFPIWVGFFVPWLVGNLRQTEAGERRLKLAPHLGAVAVFGLIAAIWLVPFFRNGGPDLFQRWLLDNQLGRVSGGSDLGHTGHDRLSFYIGPLLTLAAPWSPLLLVFGARFLRPRASRPRITPGELALLTWAVGTVALLTLSSTKRSIYALPTVVPVALLAAATVPLLLSSVLRWFFGFVMIASVAALAGTLVLPLAHGIVSSFLHEQPILDLARTIPTFHPVTLLGILLSVVFLARPRTTPLAVRAGGCVAMVLMVNLLVIKPAQDLWEDMGPAVRELGALLPQDGEVARHGLGENEISALSFHAGRIFPAVDEARLDRILAGEDPEFSSVLIGGREGHESRIEAHRLLHEVCLGDQLNRKNRHLVLWLTGPAPVR